MKEKGPLPDLFCYNMGIIGLCKANKFEEARIYLVEMIDRGIKPNVYTYGAFIHAYCKAGANACCTKLLNRDAWLWY